MTFETSYTAIINKLEQVDPIAYGKTRNYVQGNVTYLSPYISRGVISTKKVFEYVLNKGYKPHEIESFIQELCWRDYFQRVAQNIELLNEHLQEQTNVLHNEIPEAIVQANTGIEGIDNAIKNLYSTGYMHNHARMYLASLVCNIAAAHWQYPAQWLYYYLLDGDFASNTCSWQWVAGVRSKKKYFANQENINKYTGTLQYNTFLDVGYDEFPLQSIPEVLKNSCKENLTTPLPNTDTNIKIDHHLPTYIYNYYNLDPLWHNEKKGNRILLLEPDHFEKNPVSGKCIQFMLSLGKNIDGLQVYVGSFSSFYNTFDIREVYYKEHPLNINYIGTEEPRDWIVPEVTGYYPSFFAYWKKIKKQLL